VSGLLTAAALSPKVTVGGRLILELPQALYAPLGPFRASGRFFLPVFFAIAYLLLRTLMTRLGARLATVVLVGILWLQYTDLATALNRIRFATRGSNGSAADTWQLPLQWSSWAFAQDGFRRLELVPPDAWGDQAEVVKLVYLAARTGLASDLGEAARSDSNSIRRWRRAAAERFAQGLLEPEVLYVVHPQHLPQVARIDGTTCRPVDGFFACWVRLEPGGDHGSSWIRR
jgi:hypothetical protein